MQCHVKLVKQKGHSVIKKSSAAVRLQWALQLESELT